MRSRHAGSTHQLRRLESAARSAAVTGRDNEGSEMATRTSELTLDKINIKKRRQSSFMKTALAAQNVGKRRGNTM